MKTNNIEISKVINHTASMKILNKFIFGVNKIQTQVY